MFRCYARLTTVLAFYLFSVDKFVQAFFGQFALPQSFHCQNGKNGSMFFQGVTGTRPRRIPR